MADTDIELTQQQRDEIAAKIAGLQNSEMPHSLVGWNRTFSGVMISQQVVEGTAGPLYTCAGGARAL